MERGIIKRAESFEVHHKIISFLIILIVTIFITRTLSTISDPNIIIKGFELHHFYYGLILLIIISLFMLFQRGHFKTHLIVTAIAIGLIVDEILFVGTKIRGPIEYSSTLAPTIVIAIAIVLVAETIFYFTQKRKR